MHRHVIRALVTAAAVCALTVGCGGESSAPASSDDDEINARTYAFVDVNPDAPLTPLAKSKIQAALGKLDRVAKRGESPLRRALAAETLARVESGQVMLGSIAGARGIDRWHMCKDYKLDACKGAPPAADDRTWRGDAEVERVLDRDLAGYMWGNRLYFTLHKATDPNELASTLVHEINHVANRSECHYYANIETHDVEPDLAFVEEYRAFFSECYFTHDTTASPEVCSGYAFDAASTYGLAFDLKRVLPSHSGDPLDLAKAIVKSEEGPAPFGRLVPRASTWPASFGACVAR